MTDKHTVGITIIWPDNIWAGEVENEYLISCLEGVIETLKERPIENRDHRRCVLNTFGRVYAEIHISPCKKV